MPTPPSETHTHTFHLITNQLSQETWPCKGWNTLSCILVFFPLSSKDELMAFLGPKSRCINYNHWNLRLSKDNLICSQAPSRPPWSASLPGHSKEKEGGVEKLMGGRERKRVYWRPERERTSTQPSCADMCVHEFRENLFFADVPMSIFKNGWMDLVAVPGM